MRQDLNPNSDQTPPPRGDNGRTQFAASRQGLRRRSRQTHRAAPPASLPSGRLARLPAVLARGGRSSGWAALVITLLVSAGALLGAGNPAERQSLRIPPRASSQTPLAATVIGRWHDTANGTALVIENPQAFVASGGGQRTTSVQFTLPTGDFVLLPPGQSLTALLGALTAQPADSAFDQRSHDCVVGRLVAGPNSAVPGSPAGSFVAEILVGLDLHVGRTAGDTTLLAYAGLSYSTKSQQVACAASTPQFQLLAGCDASDCFPPLPPAATVARYDNALIAAVASQDWGPVYILTAASITAQYTSAQFTAAMNQQVRQVGRITAISPVSAAQVTQQSRDGLQFFSAPQTITLVDTQGTSRTRKITSYYLFEGGSWRFWFSA